MTRQLTLLPDNVFRDPLALRDFMLAGNAKISIRSEKTMRHYTYKIRQPKDNQSMFFVSRLSSANIYCYLGTIFPDRSFARTRKSATFDYLQESYVAFNWLWKHIKEGIMPTNVTVWHEGRCGSCGKELTDPISIKAGYGPDCRRNRLRHGMMRDNKVAWT